MPTSWTTLTNNATAFTEATATVTPWSENSVHRPSPTLGEVTVLLDIPIHETYLIADVPPVWAEASSSATAWSELHD